ncbi:hypothetical protein Tco_0497121 [Tanacetum coccineum]
MAESSSQIPQQEPNPQQQDPQEEQPESPIPFESATQVEFNLDEINFHDNNEVSLLYPNIQTQNTSKVFLTSSSNVVSERHSVNLQINIRSIFLSYGTLPKPSRTQRNTIEAHYLSYSTEYVATPPLETILNKDAIILYCLANGVNIDYAKLIWEDIITKLNKKTREKIIPYPRLLSLLLEQKMEGYGSENITLNPTQVFSVHNWTLKKNQPEVPPFTDHILAIFKVEKPGPLKAPKTSSKDEKKVPKGTNPRFKSGERFIKGFSKIAKPMTKLTQKTVKFDWGEKRGSSISTSAPILSLLEGTESFMGYYDTSLKGLTKPTKKFLRKGNGSNEETNEALLEGSSLETWSASFKHV